MARTINRLSAAKVEKEKRPGYYCDGGGLWLQVTSSGAKSWCFRFMLNGRAREMGLGPARTVGLADARKKALDARQLLLAKVDPIEAREAEHREQKVAQSVEAARTITFERCSQDYIKSHRTGWKNAKHADQWETTLRTYTYPVFGKLPIGEVDTALVMRVLEPLWREKTETASRLRARIENVLSWATVRGYRSGENPARWRGHLDKLLPKRSKVAKVEHHAALPYAEIGGFVAELRQQDGVAARALEFLILTAARTGEVRGASWDEVDLKEKLWIVPADRMKAKREHRVPLSARATALVQDMNSLRSGHHVFPGLKQDQPMSNNAMLKLLDRMGRSNLTVHGFRSTFRDWAAECTNYPREVAEMALAHAVGDKVEAAYRRGDLFDKRRRIMEDWARFCGAPAGAANVVPINRGSEASSAGVAGKAEAHT